MVQFFALRATMSGVPAGMATFGEDVKWIADRVFVLGSPSRSRAVSCS